MLRELCVGIEIHDGIFEIIPSILYEFRAFKFLIIRFAFEQFYCAVQINFHLTVVSPAPALEGQPVAVPRLVGKGYRRGKNGIERRSDSGSLKKLLLSTRGKGIGFRIDDEFRGGKIDFRHRFFRLRVIRRIFGSRTAESRYGKSRKSDAHYDCQNQQTYFFD